MTTVEADHGCEVCLDEWLSAIGCLDDLPPEVQDDIRSFLVTNPLFEKIPPAFFTEPDIIATLQLAQDLHKEQIRKASGHPYIKHILQVVLTLGSQFESKVENIPVNQNQAPTLSFIEEYLAQTYGPEFVEYADIIDDVFQEQATEMYYQHVTFHENVPESQEHQAAVTSICGGACHDVLEMRIDVSKSMLFNSIMQFSGNPQFAADVSTLSQLMVPPDKPKAIPPREYLRAKLSDMVHVLLPPGWINRKYTRSLRNIKAADLFGNVTETIRDVEDNNDGGEQEKGLFSGDFRTRVTMFCLREAVLTALDPDNPFLPAIRVELTRLRQFI